MNQTCHSNVHEWMLRQLNPFLSLEKALLSHPCPKSATARFGCKQRKAGNDIGAALGGAAQRATAGRRSARSEQSSCACPHVRLGDYQTEPFKGQGKAKRTTDSVQRDQRSQTRTDASEDSFGDSN